MVSRRNSASSTASQDGSALADDQWDGVFNEDQAQREVRVQEEKKERAKKSRYENVPSRREQELAAAAAAAAKKGRSKK